MDLLGKLSGDFDALIEFQDRILTPAGLKSIAQDYDRFPIREIANQLRETLFGFHYLETDNDKTWLLTKQSDEFRHTFTGWRLRRLLSGFFYGLFNTNNKHLSRQYERGEQRCLIYQASDYPSTLIFNAEDSFGGFFEGVAYGPEFSNMCCDTIEQILNLKEIFHIAHGIPYDPFNLFSLPENEQQFDDSKNKLNEKLIRILDGADRDEVELLTGFVLSMFINELTEIDGILYDLNNTRSLINGNEESHEITKLRNRGRLPPLKSPLEKLPYPWVNI